MRQVEEEEAKTEGRGLRQVRRWREKGRRIVKKRDARREQRKSDFIICQGLKIMKSQLVK